MDKHPLQQLLEDCGFKTESYSGRGMYGRKCLSVEVGREQTIGELFSVVLEQIDGQDDVQTIADGFHFMCWDHMGLNMVYYFPNVPFTSEEKDEEEVA